MFTFALFAFLATFGFSSAAVVARQASGPSVKFQDGIVVGQSNNSVDSFRGIPYAKPPVAGLRLKPPQPIDQPFGTLELPVTEKACPQQFFTGYDTTGFPPAAAAFVNQIFIPLNDTSEDCLTVNVQRPAGISPDAKLPVLFWIFGGGFETGSTATYDATGLLKTSVSMGTPFIYVAVNYRVSGFGFLPGKELSEDGSTNLGLRDQRLALEWVAENIAAFGGDPNRVTIWGESSGAASVFSLLTVNGGDNTYNGKPLYQGAIMDSGTVFPTLPVDSPKAQDVYDSVVESAGCADASNTLECLRALPLDQFSSAVNAQPFFLGNRSLDLAFFPREDSGDSFYSQGPLESLAKGAIAKVPVINGVQEDEGTIFAPSARNLTTTEEMIAYLASFFPNASQDDVAGLVATYPDDPAAGSPFRTGTENQLFPQYKRLAAIEGDFFFTMIRRIVLEQLSKLVPSYSYLGTYLYGFPLIGTSHISDVPAIYQLQPKPQPGHVFQSYYINFVNNLDPNIGPTSANATNWPRYENAEEKMINVSATEVTCIKDDFRQTSSDYIREHLSVLQL